MTDLMQDASYAVRGLLRRPAFAVVVLATLGLGIGANAAIFSVVSGILLHPLPYPNADRLFSFGHEPPQWLTSQPDFLDYQRGMRTLDGLAAYTRSEATITGRGEPERVRLARSSDAFFAVLGVPPLFGRTFADEEYVPRQAPTVVISYDLLQRRFGGDPSIVGSKVTINGFPRIVVGVMPPHFDYPEKRTDAWMPLARFNPDSLDDRANHYLFAVGRLKPGATIERARVEATGIARRIMHDYPEKFDPKQPLVPHLSAVRDDLVGNTRPYLFALLGAVGFVLLIACANVANLLLVHGDGRRKEMALRSALGASSRRLVTQLLTESALLSVLGGALGLALAWSVDRTIVALAPGSIPRLAEIGVDWRVLAFTAAASCLTGLLVGVLPAWRVAHGAFADALKEGGKSTGTRGAAAAVRRTLVIVEVALAVVTLAGAGMLLRSLWNLQNAGLGFDPHNVLTAKISISPRDYGDARTAIFFDQVIARVRTLPGVRAVGASGWLPVVDAGGLWGYRPEGGSYPDGRWPQAVPQQVTGGYFTAVGLPLLAGRDVTAGDRADAPLVAVVSKRFADVSWPGENAIGKRFRLGGAAPFMTVVGIVGDFRSRGFDDTPEATMYFPLAQAAKSAYFAPRAMALLVRVDGGDPMSLARAVRSTVRSLDGTAPVSEMRTLEEVVGTSVANRRFNTALLAGFAVLALVLAGIGTYGVISYGVAQRTYEIGVRMALGAEQRSVLTLVLSEGLRMCALGVLIGVAGSVVIGRTISALLVGVTPMDVPTLTLVSALLVCVGLLACVLPARRAMAVSPTEVLRAG